MNSNLLRFSLFSIVAVLTCWTTGCGQTAAPPKQVNESAADIPAGPVKVDFGAGSKPILLSATDFKTRRSKSSNEFVTIVDARPKGEYDAGHIPKSVHLDVETWKAQALKPEGLTDQEAWSILLGKLGVTRLSYVVVYSDKPQDSARVWWTLKYLGIPNAAVLDGGWKEWVAARGDVTAEETTVKPFKTPIEFQPARLMQAAELKTSHKSADLKVVDARSQDEFGKGRIPGSVRLEWSELLTAEGKFKSPDELKAIFKERGLDQEKTTVTYCESGGRSSLDAFALELAGYPKVKNYYCSWQEWSADKAAPVEK